MSVKPFGAKPTTFAVKQAGNDQRVVREVAEHLNEFDAWATYYGKGFDVPMINTRLLKWRLPPLVKKPHIDLYFQLKAKLLLARKSQGHILGWLEPDLPEPKKTVSADIWAMIVGDIEKHMPEMIARCESDTKGLEILYNRVKHLIVDITR